jgi:hypothetical protein
VENYQTETNRNSEKKEENGTGNDTHYIKKQDQ